MQSLKIINLTTSPLLCELPDPANRRIGDAKGVAETVVVAAKSTANVDLGPHAPNPSAKSGQGRWHGARILLRPLGGLDQDSQTGQDVPTTSTTVASSSLSSPSPLYHLPSTPRSAKWRELKPHSGREGRLKAGVMILAGGRGRYGDREEGEKDPLLRERLDSKSHFKVFSKTRESTITLLILPIPPLDSHLSNLPSETSLKDIVLPGTHESLALHGWPFSRCQDPKCTVDVQLEDGIRFFDVRLGVRDGVLLAYHGYWPQLLPFPTLLAQLTTFLLSHPLETFIMCIQQEAPSSPLFSRLVRSDMEETISRGLWFLENRIPTLGEVRGKGILMSRFGGGRGEKGDGPWRVPSAGHTEKEGEEEDEREVRMGWRPNWWPNNRLEGFEWETGDDEGVCRTQDWYDIAGFFNIPAKANVLIDHLTTSSNLPPATHLNLSFASAASIPLALPPMVANGFGWPSWGLGMTGVNDRLKEWLLDELEEETRPDRPEGRGGVRGIVPLDFYKGSGLVELMLVFNTL